jgi:hypothetical protein
MARRILDLKGYTLNPATRVITYPGIIKQEQLILITNVTAGQVIYNFSDPSLKATAYITSIAGATGITTITLNFNTAAMLSTDKLQFIIDQVDETISPSEALKDPVNKLRVSQAQALIDTDFEYGSQQTKWENLAMINNRPFAFPSANAVTNISAITMSAGSKVVTVTRSSGNFGANGSAIYVQDTFLTIANGNFIIESGGGTGTITYSARANNGTAITDILDPNKTAVYEGSLYSSARIGGAPTMTYSGRKITVTTTVSHGLSIGNEIAVTGTTASTNAPNGTHVVSTVLSPTVFEYYVNAAPTGTLVATSAFIYVVPQGQVLHRPFDGGVIFSSNSSSNNEQLIRQTRRYFRYQSGKGIQISSGTILKPNLQLDSITSSGLIATVLTKEKHNILPGTVVTIAGCFDAAYNGTFEITSVTGFNTFQYTMLSEPTTTVGTGPYYAAINGWHGAVNRIGSFDQQNGLFWEFDGQTLFAVRRNSTFQLSGRVTVTNGSSTVTQTNASFPTSFAKQLAIGDYIVLRGQSYKVDGIASDTSLTISPTYRGATANHVVASKTVETRIPQSQFNIDKIDGTGPSGFNIDLTKMQMFYIDYSWYGAGFIRWGVRGINGDVYYVHKMENNNINQEAYMRSGNLPARYESSSLPPITATTALVGSLDLSLSVVDTLGFPDVGTLAIKNGSTTEFVNYSSRTATSFLNLTRAKAGITTAATLTIAVGSNVGTLTSVANVQVGMRVNSASIPEGTYVTSFNASNNSIILSAAATAANPTDVLIVPMGANSAQTFAYSATAPTSVELAFPSYGPSLSHWGTSVIMDGGYDDDASLIFTYGMTTPTVIPSGQSRALFSIRVAPSADNGISAGFGQRDLINRMQLKLNALDVSTRSSSSNYLVRAFLNATPSSAATWTSPTDNAVGIANSSLSQIAAYPSGSNVTVTGGEVTGGFLSQGTTSVDLTKLRDLGNSILGGGSTASNTQFYPDGPDTLTVVVTNLGSSGSIDILGRLSWTEAQA